jgi:hypothetical protein
MLLTRTIASPLCPLLAVAGGLPKKRWLLRHEGALLL